MKFLRDHWYDLGGCFALLTAAGVVVLNGARSEYQLVMWLNLISLFLHQLEEYRVIGTFPGLINTALYKSDIPDRYPLNPQTSLLINAGIGWGTYLLAAVFAERAVWLGIATMLVSAGNVIAHVFLFNIKARRLFNPGMFTAVMLFVPLCIWFAVVLRRYSLAGWSDYALGIALGIILNVVGVLKMIDWLADRETPYRFKRRQMWRG